MNNTLEILSNFRFWKYLEIFRQQFLGFTSAATLGDYPGVSAKPVRLLTFHL